MLLGKTGSNEGERLVFIDGAVEAENVIVQEDQVVFTSEVWSSLYEEIDRYFHNTEVVGWFITRPGKSLGINEKITKSHVDNFAGEDKTLLVSDPVDRGSVFYIYEQGRLIRQDGYYIYYERNEDMQNYMVDHREGGSSESQVKDILRRGQEKRKAEDSLTVLISSLAVWIKKKKRPGIQTTIKLLRLKTERVYQRNCRRI